MQHDDDAFCAYCTAFERWSLIRHASNPSGSALPMQPPPPKPRRRAWVTLLSHEAYYPGVQALYNSLQVADTEHPLVVMLTSAITAETRSKLAALGDAVELRDVEALPLPCGTGGRPQYACAHFADCWLKLRMWEWEPDFELLCYLDADMLLLKNMDELLESTPPPLGIRAVPECGCVSGRGDGRCYYVEPRRARRYFNAGLLVLAPSAALLRTMLTSLSACDLSEFTYAEQDFLNAFFRNAWDALPWGYNATKGLYAKHRETVWELSKVRNLHYTMAKPWNLRDACHKGYEQLNELWRAAFVDPRSLTRVTLRAVLQEKKARMGSREASERP